MSRLTDRDGESPYYIKCFESPCFGEGCAIKDCDFGAMVCEKLAQYEDICDNPEELKAAWEKSQGKKVDTVGNKCPVCKCYLASEPIGDRYCFNCGQKILWENANGE